MVSVELLRRFPFFAGLNFDQLDALARASDEKEVEAGHFFLHERDENPYLYLVLDGEVTVVLELTGQNKEVIVGDVGPGEVFAWSALVPPHTATASVKATSPCHVVAIDCCQLLKDFEQDPAFGYLMMTKAAQITRDRVVTLTIETLAYLAE